MRNAIVWIDSCFSPELACHRAHRLGKAVLKAGGPRLSLNYITNRVFGSDMVTCDVRS
jgi:hypothetical protein